MTSNDGFTYDEDASVRFIQNYLPQELKNRFTDDDIIYILDLVDEFYDQKGDVEPTDDDYEQYEQEIIDFIINNAAKDKVGEYTDEEIEWILDAELEYCESLNEKNK
jgi:hypothetical protein